MRSLTIPTGISMMLAAILTAVSTAAVSTAASAQSGARSEPCGPRSMVVGNLAEQYQESPVAIGVTSGGGLVEVLSSSGGETWTIIDSTPEGVSCLIAAGEGWRPIEFEAALTDSSI